MSMTPKLHIVFVNLLRLLERVQGFGNLGNDSGEWAHQEEASNKSRVGTVVNLSKKERTKSYFEAMNKGAKVKEIKSALRQKSKSNFKIDVPSRAEKNGPESKLLI